MKREAFFHRYFEGKARVIDIGCGEGLFLEYLKNNNIPAEGVDLSEASVKKAKARGLAVTCSDASEFLSEKAETYDGAYMSHVAEHLDFKELTGLFKSVYKCLKQGGIFVVVTPDIKNLKDITGGFWDDPTHIRPYPLPALTRVFEDAGFSVLEAVEKKRPYDRMLWRLRDSLRRVLVGDHWGRDEVYVVGKK